MFEIKLDDEGNLGYIRFKSLYPPLLLDKFPVPLIEAFKVCLKYRIKDINDLANLDSLFCYRVFHTMLSYRKLEFIGNVPVNPEFRLPDVYTTDMFTGQDMLIQNNIKIPVDVNQVSNAVFYGTLGYEGVRLQYIDKLKESGLYIK